MQAAFFGSPFQAKCRVSTASSFQKPAKLVTAGLWIGVPPAPYLGPPQPS